MTGNFQYSDVVAVFIFYIYIEILKNRVMELNKVHEGFKKLGGELVPDLGQYLRDFLSHHDDVRIYIGVDSETLRKHTQYGLVVVMYHYKKGAHFIFKRENAKDADGRRVKVRDLWSKLWREVELAKALGDYLEVELAGSYRRFTPEEVVKEGHKPHQTNLVDIDLDLNPEPGKAGRNKSNSVHDAGVQYIVGSGFRVRTKPHAWSASCAADMIVDRDNRVHRKGKSSKK